MATEPSRPKHLCAFKAHIPHLQKDQAVGLKEVWSLEKGLLGGTKVGEILWARLVEEAAMCPGVSRCLVFGEKKINSCREERNSSMGDTAC